MAQAFAPPGERMIKLDGTAERLYTYDGQILLTAARLYQGRDEFQNAWGGFASVRDLSRPLT